MLREVFEKTFPPAALRRWADGQAALERSWSALAEVGLMAVAVPAAAGGLDGSLVDVAIGFREAGRALYPARLRTTVVGALALAGATGSSWADQLRTGGAVAALVTPAPGAVHAEPAAGGFQLSGTVPLVAGAPDCDVLVVLVDGRAVPVPRTAQGVRIIPRQTWTGDDADVVFEQSTAEAGVALATERIVDIDRVLRCAEMVGGTEAVLEKTARYVLERHQFGRQLGAFQAVQHALADMRMAIDLARLAMFHAAWHLDRNTPQARAHLLAALTLAGPGYSRATVTAHQLHGGMGFSRENDLHLWSERAKGLELTTARRAAVLAELADELAVALPDRAAGGRTEQHQ